jgi:Tfp pilus assembly protein PilO
MDAQFIRDLITVLLTALVLGVGYLLKHKDDMQQKQRDEDAVRNQEIFNSMTKKIDDNRTDHTLLQRDIDKKHYERHEVDHLIERVETTMHGGFSRLGGQLDILHNELKGISLSIAAHIGKEGDKK